MKNDSAKKTPNAMWNTALAHAKFKHNSKQNKNLRDEHEAAAPEFPEGGGGVDNISQSQVDVECQIREIERQEKEQQERKAALLAKRSRKPSTPGTDKKAKRAKTAAADPKHIITVDGENAEEVTN